MSPRPDVSEERKYQILDAAEQVFATKGLDGARMDDIAEHTRLSKGTLYLYFKNKDELIIALMDRVFQREFRAWDDAHMTDDTSAESVINQFMESSIDGLTHIMRLMPIAYEFLSLAFRNSMVQKILEQYYNRYMTTLTTIIQHGIDRGEFRQANAEDIAIAIGAIFEGTILLWVYSKKRVDLEHNIRAGVGFVMDGVRAQA